MDVVLGAMMLWDSCPAAGEVRLVVCVVKKCWASVRVRGPSGAGHLRAISAAAAGAGHPRAISAAAAGAGEHSDTHLVRL
jgi:hypothetical protein